MSREPVCIACGQAIGPEPQLNRLPDGRACTRCSERLLDSLPPILPSPRVELVEEWGGEEEDEGGGGDDDYLKGA